MSSSSNYEPKYGTINHVPVSGPGPFESNDVDPFTETEKREALAHAEAQLEADVNDGDEISTEAIERLHREAANSYASYRLVTGPASPSSARLGDFADDGSDRMDLAHEFLEMYERAVTSINAAEGDQSGGEDGESGATRTRSTIL